MPTIHRHLLLLHVFVCTLHPCVNSPGFKASCAFPVNCRISFQKAKARSTVAAAAPLLLPAGQRLLRCVYPKLQRIAAARSENKDCAVYNHAKIYCMSYCIGASAGPVSETLRSPPALPGKTSRGPPLLFLSPLTGDPVARTGQIDGITNKVTPHWGRERHDKPPSPQRCGRRGTTADLVSVDVDVVGPNTQLTSLS